MIKDGMKKLFVICFIMEICASQDLGQFRSLQLQRHNQKRALHQNTPALKLNETLNSQAQAWANHLAADNLFEHSNDHRYGQNLFKYWIYPIQKYSPELFDATASWYAEIKDYNYSNPGFSFETGHFTQVVWKDTTDVGFGIVQNGTDWYVVANYYPPGNYNNNFANNVLPLKSGLNSSNPIPTPQPLPQPQPQPTLETQPQYIIKFRQEQLKKQNQYRKMHNATDLSLDGSLNKLAQQCAQNNRDGIQCNGNYGRSSYSIYSTDQRYNYTVDTPTWASNAWYKRKQNYNPQNPSGNAFTAMVWKGTTAVGFGLANKYQNGHQNWYIVAYYNPPGNIRGQYSKNVQV